MSSEPLTTEQIEQFHRDGYLIVESMFDAEEMELLKRAAKEDHELEAHAYSKEDGEGADHWDHGTAERAVQGVNVERVHGNWNPTRNRRDATEQPSFRCMSVDDMGSILADDTTKYDKSS